MGAFARLGDLQFLCPHTGHPQAVLKISGDIVVEDDVIHITNLTQAEVLDENNPNRASTHWVFPSDTQLRFSIPDHMVQSYVYFHPRKHFLSLKGLGNVIHAPYFESFHLIERVI